MSQVQSIRNEPIAIVGMGCRLPGANNIDEYWQLISNGQSAVAEIPAERLDQELYYDPKVGVRNKTYSKLAALLKSRQFDRQVCPLPESLIKSVDICHLLMCQTAAEALRHAKMDPFNLPNKNVGVYIGHAQGSELGGDFTYAQYIEEAVVFLQQLESFQSLPETQQRSIVEGLVNRVRSENPRRTADSPDVAANMIAGTITQGFGLDGPFMAMDSACASSLQAMLFGARALQLGEVDMAIVGGASDVKSDSLVLFSAARALSATGTRPFDSDADGLIIAEGYVVLAMKRLSQALADGDPIQAIVRGMGVSTDGKGKSLWAPLKEGQKKAMERAYQNTYDLSSLQYIECHATATQVGDATELETLSEFLGPKIQGKKIPIGSVKANIGHTLEAAGMAGLIKTVLAMQNRRIPPAINVRKPNESIDWNQVPIQVPTNITTWPEPEDGSPRRAGVNAFGIGGLNMHVALEEFQPNSQIVQSVQSRSGREVVTSPGQANEPIAIVGMGCFFPGANDLDGFWELIQSGRDPKQTPPEDRWRLDSYESVVTNFTHHRNKAVGGFITDFEYDWRRHKVPPRQVQQADPLQFMLLESADQAMRHAGYDQKEFKRERTGVLVGSEFGGDFAFQLQLGLRLPELGKYLLELMSVEGVPAAAAQTMIDEFSKNLLKHWPSLIDETGSFTSSTLASRLAKTWNVQGGAAAIDSGANATMATLNTAINQLRAGDVDMMICATGQRRMGVPAYEGLLAQEKLATDPSRSPLDERATGIVPGEGVGAVVLKRLSDARRDGDEVHAIIHQLGFARSESLDDSLRTAIRRSSEKSSIPTSDIALYEFDGSGAPQDNSRQLSIIANEYNGNRTAPLLVSSITGQIGFSEGGSGMASLIKASLELKHGHVPPTVGLQTPATALGWATAVKDKQRLTPTREGRQFASVATSNRGLAFHAILESGQPVAVSQAASAPAAVSTSADFSTCRFVANDFASASQMLSQQATTATLQQASTNRFGVDDQVRIAIVANSTQDLRTKLSSAAGAVTNQAAWATLQSQGVFIQSPTINNPSVAFLFAGQGSQYKGMCRSLIAASPAARESLKEANDALQQAGLPSFEQMAWSDHHRLGVDVLQTQLSMLVADHLFFGALVEAGLRPDCVAGHSYGEFAALLAAKVWNIETAIAVTQARCQGIEQAGSLGGMLATTVTPREVTQLANEIRDPVYVANHNSPNQTVVGGSYAAIEEFEQLLKSKGIAATKLKVPAPFHTPLMRRATGPIQQALRAASLSDPNIEAFSVATNQPIQNASEIPHNLVNHMTNPVRYVNLIETITSPRPTILVEVGPGQTLTRLHQKIDPSHFAIASDNQRKDAAESIARVVAYAETVGWSAQSLPKTTLTGHSIPSTKPNQPAETPKVKQEIVRFDATERRRQKMRAAAENRVTTPAIATVPATPNVVVPSPETPLQHSQLQAQPSPPAEVSSVEVSRVNDEAIANTSASSPARDENLEQFLIEFVVDQTGYPPEVVELDADLEADLGIDSIKKAQLFAELNEHFQITPTEDLSLDDFPTLRDVVNFLRKSDQQAPGLAKASDVQRTVVEPRPQVASTSTASVAAPAIDPSEPVTNSPKADVDLEAFLIEFVVEQTGYPPEVVELDADLEADLGIDSIKKAQLFAELNEHFQITPTDDLSLDDFPTLRNVVDFLRKSDQQAPNLTQSHDTVQSQHKVQALETGHSHDMVVEPLQLPTPSPQAGPVSQLATPQPTTEVAVPTAVSTPPVAGSTQGHADLEKFLVDFVVEQTGYPTEVVELDADLEADLGIDSIKKAQLFAELNEHFQITPTDDLSLDDFPTLRHVFNFLAATETSAPTVASSVATTSDAAPPPSQPVALSNNSQTDSQLETFLIDFVVEQTGYPPEVVELDADLEADLGIDSIKKAQLFAELNEHFQITPTEDLTLDDFPTLRHVVEFLAASSSSVGDSILPKSAATSLGLNSNPSLLNEPQSQQSPFEFGRQQGTQFKQEVIRSLCRLADLPQTDWDSLRISCEANRLEQVLSATESEELRGIAEGLDTPIGGVALLNLFVASKTTENGSQPTSSAIQRVTDSLQPISQTRIDQTGNPITVNNFAGAIGAVAEPRRAAEILTQIRLNGAPSHQKKTAPKIPQLEPDALTSRCIMAGGRNSA